MSIPVLLTPRSSKSGKDMYLLLGRKYRNMRPKLIKQAHVERRAVVVRSDSVKSTARRHIPTRSWQISCFCWHQDIDLSKIRMEITSQASKYMQICLIAIKAWSCVEWFGRHHWLAISLLCVSPAAHSLLFLFRYSTILRQSPRSWENSRIIRKRNKAKVYV